MRITNVKPKKGFTLTDNDVVPIRDGLINVLTGAGTGVDRKTFNSWYFRQWGAHQIEAAYRGNWLHRKIVDIAAEDMTRAGRNWDGDKDQIEKIEAEEKRLQIWPKLREAIRLGRLGGGAIVIGMGDDSSLSLETKRTTNQIQHITVWSRWQITLGDCITDPADPLYGQPQFFQLNGTSVKIHPSRVICFKGMPTPQFGQTTWQDTFWGDSVTQTVDEAVQHATVAANGFAGLIDEAKVDTYRLSGMFETLSRPDGEALLAKRVQATSTGKSIHRAVFLDKEDDWEQRQLTWAGMRDMIVAYDSRVSGAADIPATRLFGKAPDGMNASGQGDMDNYVQSISAKQEMDLRQPLERLDAIMLPSAGVIDSNLTWVFSPIQVMSEKEQAEIENKEADTVAKLVGTALIPEDAFAKAVQNRLIESQRFPGLKEAIEESNVEGDLPVDDPSALIEA